MEVVPALDVLKYGHPGFGLCAVVSAIQAFAFKRGEEVCAPSRAGKENRYENASIFVSARFAASLAARTR